MDKKLSGDQRLFAKNQRNQKAKGLGYLKRTKVMKSRLIISIAILMGTNSIFSQSIDCSVLAQYSEVYIRTDIELKDYILDFYSTQKKLSESELFDLSGSAVLPIKGGASIPLNFNLNHNDFSNSIETSIKQFVKDYNYKFDELTYVKIVPPKQVQATLDCIREKLKYSKPQPRVDIINNGSSVQVSITMEIGLARTNVTAMTLYNQNTRQYEDVRDKYKLYALDENKVISIPEIKIEDTTDFFSLTIHTDKFLPIHVFVAGKPIKRTIDPYINTSGEIDVNNTFIDNLTKVSVYIGGIYWNNNLWGYISLPTNDYKQFRDDNINQGKTWKFNYKDRNFILRINKIIPLDNQHNRGKFVVQVSSDD